MRSYTANHAWALSWLCIQPKACFCLTYRSMQYERMGQEGYLLQLAALQGNGGAGAVAGQANLLLALGAGFRVAGQRAGVLAGSRPLTWQLALPAVLSGPVSLHGETLSACKLLTHWKVVAVMTCASLAVEFIQSIAIMTLLMVSITVHENIMQAFLRLWHKHTSKLEG